MKNLKFVFIFLVMLSITNVATCQDGFVWQIKDSINLTKNEIYSLNKQFIAKTWRSAKDVIQNDDQNGGVILVKGLSSPISFIYLGATYSYTYSYSMSFKMKDNKYFLELNDVRCYSTVGSSFVNNFFIEVGEYSGDKKWDEKCRFVMGSLKTQLQSIIDNYKLEISKAPIKSEDW